MIYSSAMHMAAGVAASRIRGSRHAYGITDSGHDMEDLNTRRIAEETVQPKSPFGRFHTWLSEGWGTALVTGILLSSPFWLKLILMLILCQEAGEG